MKQTKRKPAKGHKGKKKAHKKGFGLGAISKADQEKYAPISFFGGLLGGSLIGWGIDKMIPPTPTPGKFDVKGLIKPVTLLAVGAGTAYAGRKHPIAKNFGLGVVGSSIVAGTKTLLKKDLFAGLGAADDSKPNDAQYYTEAKEDVLKLLKDNSFTPQLPSVSGPGESEGSTARSMSDQSSEDYINGLSFTEDAHYEVL